MKWSIFLTALTTCFLAELGDKTQLAAISLASSSKSPWSVFLGAVLGLALVTGIGVFLGETITKLIPENYLKKISALLFVGIGVWMWFKDGGPL